MKIKMWIVVLLSIPLGGCELVSRYKIVDLDKSQLDQRSEQFCVDTELQTSDSNNCDLPYWVNYWIESNQKPWEQRKAEISGMGDSNIELFKKVLLSQGKGTPYQNRLRAQSWIEQLKPKLSPLMDAFVKRLVYDPSQEVLEFESALTILGRVNGNQSTELEAMQNKIQQQHQQIEQLLKIEVSMLEKREGINP